ncbi:MAG: VacJ family lipoprotein [Pseudomonadales bacterium]|nr:VacJ family lipoprotein [Pseudomonadales bacterium]
MHIRKLLGITAVSNAPIGLPMRPLPLPPGIALAIFFILGFYVQTAAASNDPLEPINRGTHEFNRVVDRIFMRPLARAYSSVAPPVVKKAVSNFFGNLNDVKVGFSHLAQLKLEKAAIDFGRVLVNSTVGVGGLVDVADSGFGLAKNNQDFGLTLAHYGMGSGPYLVLPFLGPSTLRDAFGQGIDLAIDPLRTLNHVPTRNSLSLTRASDFRSKLLHFDELIVGDSYLFLKEAYLQQREFQIDGNQINENLFAKR